MRDTAVGCRLRSSWPQLNPSCIPFLKPTNSITDIGRGCVLVSSVAPGSNAEKCGKVLVGDMICYLGKVRTYLGSLTTVCPAAGVDTD